MTSTQALGSRAKTSGVSRSVYNDIAFFSGRSHPELARAICARVGRQLGAVDIHEFANENLFVQYQENIRQRDVFLIQTFSSPVNTSIMELLIMIDAAKRASAGRITAVIPYYAYGRSDKKDQPRVPITARLLANMIETAGADRVLTMNLHAGQIQGFFNIPLDELNALYPISNYLKTHDLSNYTVVATDVGDEKRARDMAAKLGVPLAIIAKRRLGNTDISEATSLIGEVDGRNVLIIDDEIATGGTIIEAVRVVRDNGAQDVIVGGYHGILAGKAVPRLRDAQLKEVVFTDSVPISGEKLLPNMKIIPIAPLFGDAISRIHSGQSVGALFQ
ncbi:MAG: ribose-phosphate pyrophosphokinase [Dehalococcoidia bacterium]|nr:ribose-phosphate pyrophosphokinase [Dehalococcoidia bacterium]MCA9824989.1 ribose-phosphate pyrophosphokinase [Dehalococcoidia bacterium]MCA9844992.1 ribose-phosphate pyrophosphokinase [Dehalococcoidia bacterium]MCA9852073.1 ribose-phosphate pyrophosphokinase [Dehalococcoidia bacterium]